MPPAPAARRRSSQRAGAKPVPAAGLGDVARRYAVAITPAMEALIDPADPLDPIAAQFAPDLRELDTRAEELADPIGDGAHSPVGGIVHRYPDRALLKIVHVCPVYCRFCFRREMVGPGKDSVLTKAKLEAALDYLAGQPGVREVIVTGGDPFILPARRIAALMAALGAIPHVKTVRFHTRVPVVAPERIDSGYVAALRQGGKAVYVAVHANHPREFTAEAEAALARMAEAGLVLLSQSVLLKGVNAEADTLAELMRRFVENRVKPYYLHHPDLAPGTSHFRLTVAEGLALVRGLRGRLSGLCQPTYVLDIPGGFGKVALDGPSVKAREDGGWDVTDFRGRTHLYRDA